jgi:hypothetical protein
MTITVDWAGRVVQSDASITDIVVFHQALRVLEASETGELYPTIHAWRSLDLGGGATFNQIDFVNGWQLKFPAAGNYSIIGNLNATIVPVAGVYVERKTSAAYVTTAVGASGPTPAADVAAAVVAALGGTPVPVDLRSINGALIAGAGTSLDPWRPA